MSSTNRGGKREVSDYYATPIPVIQSFLRAWAQDFDPDLVKSPHSGVFAGIKSILDPCAGGVKHKFVGGCEPMAYPEAIRLSAELFPDLQTVTTVDIRADSPADVHGDYRMLPSKGGFDLIISNPPFCFAQEFIERALTQVGRGGYVAMLLRLNYFGSDERFPFWNRHMPYRCYVNHKRISFTKNGKSDSIEYMHAIWQEGHYPSSTMLKVI